MAGFQQRLESLTRRWWFLAPFVALFFLPSYSARPYDPRRTSDLLTAVLSNPLINGVPALFPLFKALPMLLVAALIVWGDRATRALSAYAAATILACALLQNSARTDEYGVAIIVGNVVVYTLVALAWFWELVVKVNRFTPRRRAVWRYWVVPAAFLAFWFPARPPDAAPDFSLAQLATNSAGLAICMILPWYLAVLTLYHPTVNPIVLRLTSLAGVVTGLLNMLQWFVLAPYVWMGVLHLPLVSISVFALVLSFGRPREASIGGPAA